jgi:hypothetical protein
MNIPAQFEPWEREAEKILGLVVGAKPVDSLLVLQLVGTFLAAIVAMKIVGRAVGATHATWTRAVIAPAAAVALLFAALIPLRLYVFPLIDSAEVQRWTQLIALTLTVLVIMTPALSLLLGATFVQTLISLALTVMIALLFFLAVTGVFSVTRYEKGEFRKIEKRKVDLDKLMRE